MAKAEQPSVSGKENGQELVGGRSMACMVKVYPQGGHHVGVEQARERLASTGFEIDEQFGVVPINPPGERSYMLVRGRIPKEILLGILAEQEEGDEARDVQFWPAGERIVRIDDPDAVNPGSGLGTF
jgi:hypothetical protein